MRRTLITRTIFVVVVLAASLSAQTTGKTHRLEATPKTVAYGYYWSEAQPVLRIASGDTIDVDTLLTNSPTGLARAGEQFIGPRITTLGFVEHDLPFPL